MTELEDLNIPTQAKSRLEWATGRSSTPQRCWFYAAGGRVFIFSTSHSFTFTGPASPRVGAEGAPAPRFRRRRQAALHRIAVHAAQFLNVLVLSPYVEVVVRVTESLLPDMLRRVLEVAGLRRRLACAKTRGACAVTERTVQRL